MKVIISCILLVIGTVAGCSSTVRKFEKGCCTTIIKNYCTSSEVKTQLQENVKPVGKNKWNEIVIPPRYKRDCECSVGFVECARLYNDNAMEEGFEIVEFDIDIGTDEFSYRKKRQVVITSPAPVTVRDTPPIKYNHHVNPTYIKPSIAIAFRSAAITPTYHHVRKFIKPSENRSRILSRLDFIPPSNRTLNYQIQSSKLYEFDNNKTLDMSKVIVSFLTGLGSKVVNVSTSVGNFDSLDEFLILLKSQSSPSVMKDLTRFTLSRLDESSIQMILRTIYNNKPEYVYGMALRNPLVMKQLLLNEKYLPTLVSSLTMDELDKIIVSGDLDKKILAGLVDKLLLKHPGYFAASLLHNDISGIITELNRRGKLKQVVDKFV